MIPALAGAEKNIKSAVVKIYRIKNKKIIIKLECRDYGDIVLATFCAPC